MTSTSDTWRQAWRLLTSQERRRAPRVFVVIVVTALFSAVTVVSILPFLTVLADPAKIRETRAFTRLYEMFGFTSDYGFLMALGLGSLVVIVATNALQMLRLYAISSFSFTQSCRFSHRLLGRYLSQPYEFFLDSHTGDTNKGLLSEAAQIVNQFYRPLAELVAALLSALAILAVVIWVNPLIAAGALLLLGGIYAVIYGSVRSFLRRIGKERVRLNAQRYRITGEVLGGIKDVKLLGREVAAPCPRRPRPGSVCATGSSSTASPTAIPTPRARASATSPSISAAASASAWWAAPGRARPRSPISCWASWSRNRARCAPTARRSPPRPCAPGSRAWAMCRRTSS